MYQRKEEEVYIIKSMGEHLKQGHDVGRTPPRVSEFLKKECRLTSFQSRNGDGDTVLCTGESRGTTIPYTPNSNEDPLGLVEPRRCRR